MNVSYKKPPARPSWELTFAADKVENMFQNGNRTLTVDLSFSYEVLIPCSNLPTRMLVTFVSGSRCLQTEVRVRILLVWFFLFKIITLQLLLLACNCMYLQMGFSVDQPAGHTWSAGSLNILERDSAIQKQKYVQGVPQYVSYPDSGSLTSLSFYT